MPGRVGTSIFVNSSKVHSGRVPGAITAEDIAKARTRLSGRGADAAKLSDDEIEKMLAERARCFREEAPLSATGAAKIILDGVKASRWRILVGKDAERIDEMIREAPESAYEGAFYQKVQAQTGWPLR
jgi:hypothetical protein